MAVAQARNEAERDAIRDRDDWRCTAARHPEIHRGQRGYFFLPRTARRCSVVGSEMQVVEGQTMCPACMERLGKKPDPPAR